MSATYKTIPPNTAFGVLRKSHGLILTKCEVANLSAAVEGMHTITALLQQRELDSELDSEQDAPGLSFDTNVAIGLLYALAACTAFVDSIVETGGLMGERAAVGTPAYKHLNDARCAIANARRGA